MEFDVQSATNGVLAFVRENELWAVPIVFVLAFAESLAFISLILPFFTVLIAVGALVSATGSPHFWTVLFSAAVGAALGDWLSYWLGWHYHRQISTMWPIRNFPDLLPAGERFFARWGAWAVVLGRFTGPLRAAVPIVAGAVRMPSWLFQSANWSSAFLWSAVLMTLGDNLGQLVTWGWSAFGLPLVPDPARTD